MLDLAATTERSPDPAIGREFYGRARDIRRKVAAEDRIYDATIDVLIEPVRDRLRRFPHRSLRKEMLVDLVQSWRFMPCRDWRLDLSARLDRTRAALTEYRLVAGVMRRKDDPNWVGLEQDVALIRVQLDVSRHVVHLESRCVATLSLHAIARRLQRHPDGSIEALLHDVLLVAQAASGELVPGAGYRVRTDADGGGWRGRCIRQHHVNGSEQNVLSVRTWLAN